MSLTKGLNNASVKALDSVCLNQKNGRSIEGVNMKNGEKLVIVGCSGSGGPAAMMSKKLMPDVDVTVIRKEDFFIVR